LSMTVRLSPNDHVRTSDERLLDDMEWSLSVYRESTSNAHVRAHEAIGILEYHPETDGVDFHAAEGCFAWGHLDGANFDLLKELAVSGHLPTKIRVHSKGTGLRYGWEPDGSSKVWDLSADHHAYVTQLEFEIPVIAADESDELTEPEASQTTALSSPPRPVALAADLAQINSRLGWILVALMILLGVVLLRH